ncbi:MAG: hypothetical protein Q7S19_03595 [bacterium]|nr:hypothetical protein [bacterium]
MKEEKNFKIISVLSIALFFLLCLPAGAVDNYVASSTNFKIGEDSISSGGITSTSTNFGLSDILPVFSGEISTSTSFSSRQSAPAMSSAYLAISTPSNVAMSPAINTSGGGTGDGATSWTATTDSSGGYSLSIKASTGPALKSATDAFGNYLTLVTSVPDYDFRVGAGADFFGFSPEGSDISSLYKDDGVSLCNTGSNDTVNKCWDSILTSNKTFARGTASNHPNGTGTAVKFRAFAGTLVSKAAGSYSATITVTALSL